ncbi:MAG: DinB family protein [Phycisphaerales bacterium]|nr:DinB family protein [Phycisphaerales bacterium]
MEPLKIYAYLTRARQSLFRSIRPLSEAQYAREFPIGPGTLGRTLTHIMISEWYYVERMMQRDVPPYAAWPIQDEHPPSFEVLERAWNEQSGHTRAALESKHAWTEPFEYRVMDDAGILQIVTASRSDLFTQLVMHDVHHRAQVMNMLRQLGSPAEDIDFNAEFPRRPASTE